MDFREYAPSHHLSSLIENYWEAAAGKEPSAADRIVPDGCVDMLFNAGDDLYIHSLDVTLKHGTMYLGGAITRFMEAKLPQGTRLIGARFKPGAFSSFYSFSSLHEATDTFIELEPAFLPDAKALQKNVAEAFNLFYAQRRLNTAYMLKPVIDHIITMQGIVTVQELVKVHFITERQLERNFRHHIGLSPKAFANIIRYRKAYRLIRSAYPGKDLSDIALECGYYDAAHLSKAIKKYTGAAPTAIGLILSDSYM